MERLKIISIVIVILLAFTLTSCSSSVYKEYDRNYFVPTPQNLHNELLQNVDLSYNDLNLTNEELETLEKYRLYGNVLRAGAYNWSSKSEILIYDQVQYELGVSIFELEAIEKILDINISIDRSPLYAATESITNGQLDLLINTYIPKTNIKNASYLDNGIQTDFLYAYSLEPLNIEQVTDLEGLRIGVLNDLNIVDARMQQILSEKATRLKLETDFRSESTALKALKDGDIDIIIQTFSTNLIKKDCTFVNVSQLFPDDLCNITFSDQNADTKHLKSAIEKLYNYGNYMSSLKRDYMDLYSIMLVNAGGIFSDDEIAVIKDTSLNPLQVATTADTKPYIYHDSATGDWDGVTYQIWDRVASISGLNYDIVQITDKPWDEIEGMLGYGNQEVTIDAILPINSTTDNARYFQMPAPIVTDKYVVVGLHKNQDIFEINELSDKRVGVVEGYSTTEALKSYLPNEVFTNNYTNNDQLVNAVLTNEVDYIILTEVEFNEYYYTYQFYNLAVKYTMSTSYSTIAFSGEEKGILLASIFNKVYVYVRAEEIKKEYLSYDTNVTEIIRSQNRDTIIILIVAFLLVVALFVFFLLRIRSANQKVRDIAFVDNVTGLNNRTAFYNENAHASSSLLYVDIDNFKRINELYGHEAGDKFSYEIGQRISELIIDQGFKVYTMDVNSFLIVGEESNTEDKVISIAAKILYEISKGVAIFETEHKTTASIGIAFRDDENGMEELFKKADTALFIAKERGKNRYVVATEEEVATHNKKQYLQDKLTGKNIQTSIEPYFQPKIDIRDGRIIGVEALARWNNKEQGMIYPEEFLPLLRENRDISILDISILAKSCVAYMEWRAKEIIDFNFILSCNMSDITIEDTDIVSVIAKLNKEIGMPYRALELEISETAFNTNYEAMSEKLMTLARLGVNISIDNFSGNKATMRRIAQLPINIIKVSKDVLAKGVTKKSRELLELISALAKNLNLGVIINGIETQEQIQLLKEIPLYRAQGFYYCDAITAAEIEEDLRVKYIYRRS